MKAPTLILGRKTPSLTNFPVEHYSASGFVKISTNPYMFKINNINGEYLETTNSVTSILGKAVHTAMKYYLGGGTDVPTPAEEGDAIKFGFEKGKEYIDSNSDGMIHYTSTIPTRQALEEKYAYCYFEYVKSLNIGKIAKEVVMVEKMLKHTVEVENRSLPVPLKGEPDLVYRDMEGRLVIMDHKIVSSFSKDDEVDGPKLLQAAFYYFLVYAETGEKPHSIIFSEFKHTKNRDGSDQWKPYEMEFEKYLMIFELFYRMYQDVTDMLMGKQVFLPNMMTMYDKEVSLLAYIHRLDVDTEKASQMKKEKVDNLTDLLKKKIQKAGAMKQFMATVEQQFISAKTLNYKDMTIEERIKFKFAEYGISLNFEEKIVGGSVELYCYEPAVGVKMSKLEAYVKDIEQIVKVSGVRVLAPIPNSGFVGFEIPKKDRTFPTKKPGVFGFNLAIGEDVMGDTIRLDIRQAPHMLVAGSTGSGKSVFISGLIKQLQEIPKKDAQLVLLDPKMVELAEFGEGNNTRFYAHESKDIYEELERLSVEMDNRYKIMQEAKVKNIEQYNAKGKGFAYIFVFIDEYSDLVSNAKIRFEDGKIVDISENIKHLVLRLAQKARAAGIHLVITTQRPSTAVVSGDIKANFPTRVCFKVPSQVDSHVVLDKGGAEKLLGMGDMLYMAPGTSGLQRLQGYSL